MLPVTKPHPKPIVPRQRATPDRIRDLCYEHLAALKVEDCAPVLLEDKGGKNATLRTALTHHRHCRSSTALYELASTCYELADEMSRTHRLEVAELRKELASVKRCVTEWNAVFGMNYQTSPAHVHSELVSLRQQVKDLTSQLANTKQEVHLKSTHCASLMQTAKRQPSRHTPSRIIGIASD